MTKTNMKNIQSFDTFSINELSTDTYRKARKMGVERNDTRGREIAITARQLQFRQYNGKSIICRIDDDTSKGYTEHEIFMNLSIDLNGMPDREYPTGRNETINIVLITLNSSVSPDLMVEVDELSSSHPKVFVYKDSYGSTINVEFDRKSARILAKIVQDFTGSYVNPSIFKQF